MKLNETKKEGEKTNKNTTFFNTMSINQYIQQKNFKPLGVQGTKAWYITLNKIIYFIPTMYVSKVNLRKKRICLVISREEKTAKQASY